MRNRFIHRLVFHVVRSYWQKSSFLAVFSMKRHCWKSCLLCETINPWPNNKHHNFQHFSVKFSERNLINFDEFFIISHMRYIFFIMLLCKVWNMNREKLSLFVRSANQPSFWIFDKIIWKIKERVGIVIKAKREYYW